VILDLERQKFVDGFQRFRIVSHNPHKAAPVRGLEGVADRCMLLFHHRNTGRDAVVNEHWNFKVVVAEHRCNVGQMHANLGPRSLILLGLDIDFNDPAVWKQREVMSRGLMGEPHGVIATVVDVGRVITGVLMLIVRVTFSGRLGLQSCGQA